MDRSLILKQIGPGVIPTKKDFLYRIKDNNLVPGIINRKNPSYKIGDSIYTMEIDKYNVKVVELAISKFMQTKYGDNVDIYPEHISERPWVTNVVAFFSYDALYDFMKALLKMNQKDAEILLSDMLFGFGYSQVTGWFENWSR